ncbi:glycosyltransferase [Hyunsoonleella rubra]|uniref:Glycosyltransferase n=1 Tax=Hyunsoonleella rubra TaxID=1737062 RepID=A0ABW5TBA5_9FLAO
MKLSVLIPLYNAEKYIGNCLDTLIHQDIDTDDYEIIVLDDGSSDKGADVVRSLSRNSPNIVLHHQENAGFTITRNRLLKLAKGEYIYKIDSDDYVTHNSLGVLLKIAKESDLDVLGFESFDTERMDIYNPRWEKKIPEIEICSGPKYWARANNPRLGVNWYLLKRSFIDKHNITFEMGSNPFSDTPFTLRVFTAAKRFAFVPMDVHRYLQVPTSVMHNSSSSHLRKMVEYHKGLVHKLQNMSSELSMKNDPIYNGIIDSMKFWSDINVYFMLKKYLSLNVPIARIDSTLKDLKSIKAYPMTSFKGDKCFSKSHRLVTFIFNNKYLYFLALYPLRFVLNLNLIRFQD